ncbi:MAG: YceI family protein [Planctomycetota bacterium]
MKRSMIAISSAAALTLAGLGFGVATQPAGAVVTTTQDGHSRVDAGHSGVVFRIMHQGIAPFYGRFNSISGSFHLANGGSMNFQIETETVDTASAGRDRHLKSPDFFNVQQFPRATFESTSIRDNGDGTFNVTGDLTIRGETNEISFVATKTGEGERRGGYATGFEATVEISRSAFGVSALPQGLGDEVTLMIFIQGNR